MKAYFSLSVEVRYAIPNSLERVFFHHKSSSTFTADPEKTIEQLETEYKKKLSWITPNKESSASNIINDRSSSASTSGE